MEITISAKPKEVKSGIFNYSNIESNSILIIRTAPKTKFGISNVYNEIDIPLYSNNLTLESAREIKA